jgi:DNA-binding NtrC family response regulator
MLAHSWPGNVRELENTVERAVALETSEFLGTESLFLPPLTVGGGVVLGEGFCLPDHLSEVERQLAQKAMTMASGQRTEAARLLGIKYRALNHILAKAGQ